MEIPSDQVNSALKAQEVVVGMKNLVIAVSMADVESVIRQELGSDGERVLAALGKASRTMLNGGLTIVVGLEGGLPTGFSVKEQENAGYLEVLLADYETRDYEASELSTFMDGEFSSSAKIHDLGGDYGPAAEAFVDAVLAAESASEAAEYEG